MVLGPPKTGGDMYLYYSSGTYDTPVWVEIDEVSDVNVVEWDTNMAEVVTRAGLFATNFAARRRAAVEASYLFGANPTVFDYLRAAADARSIVDLLILEGEYTVTDVEGIRMQVLIENFPWNQAIEDAAMVDSIRFVNAYQLDAGGARIDPTWVTITGAGGTITPSMLSEAPAAFAAGAQPVQIAKNESLRNSLEEQGLLQRLPVGQRRLVKDVRSQFPGLAGYPDNFPVYVPAGSVQRAVSPKKE